MSQETEWSDHVSAPAHETAFASQTPADLKAAEAAVAEEWKEGDVILDLYEVKGVLGQGGFGKVYRVHHTGWNVDLAVKTPRLDRLDEASKENFKREAETWVNLGLYPHIVSCYYVRDLGGIPRVFAEFVEGGSLSDWIRSRKLYEGGKDEALTRILDVAIQFAWGLHYAHEQGLVHQDVKPANVIMTPGGVAKVTDFGLGKARGVASGENGNTARESILVESGGMTPAYASPEQSTGKPLSRATDLWSWAVSVLELFSGEVTWLNGSTAADILEGYLEVGQEDSAIPSMPEALSDLLRHCFKENPSDRPQNMLQAAQRLQEIYGSITGENYSRKVPQAAKAIADGLNNRAVSLLDLGKREEALKLWDHSLQTHPHHPESTFNRGLVLWREGKLTDLDVLTQLANARHLGLSIDVIDLLVARVHLERMDCEAVIEATDSKDTGSESEESRTTLALAQKGLSDSARQLRTFEGHVKEVRSVHLSADGRLALSGSEDLTVKLWDVATGECLRTLEGHTDQVTSVCFSSDCKFALSGSNDATIKLWDVATGECLRTFVPSFSNRIEAVSLSADRRFVLSGGTDSEPKLWDVATGKELNSFGGRNGVTGIFEGHSDWVNSVGFSADGKFALSAAGGQDETLKLWKTATGQCLRTFVGHTSDVNSVCFSADDKFALSGSDDGTLKLWNVATGECLRTYEGDRERVQSVSLTADGRLALSASWDKTLKLWETATGKCLRTFEGHKSLVNSACISADGRFALSGSMDKTLKLWKVGEFSYRAPLTLCRIVQSSTAIQNESAVQGCLARAREAFGKLELSETANYVRQARAVPGYEQYPDAIELWARLYRHLPHERLSASWDDKTIECGTDENVGSLSLSADGRVALSSHFLEFKVWELATGECLRTFGGGSRYSEARRAGEGHTYAVLSVALAADARLALSGSCDKTLMLWDMETGKRLCTFRGHLDHVTSVCFSYDGKFALSGSSDKTLKLWETTSGRCLRTLEGHTGPVGSVSLSADSSFAVSGSEDQTLKLWEMATGKCLRTLNGHTSKVKSVSLIPDGTISLSGSADGTLKLWQTATGECVRTFGDHGTGLDSVCLSADSRFALSGSRTDQSLKLWEVTTGSCLRTFEGSADYADSVSFSADSRFAMSRGSNRTTLRMWFLDWELEDRQPADWDAGAREYLHTFLMQQTPYAYSLPEIGEPSEEEITLALTRLGKPTWSERDFQRLLQTLGCVGYGWLRPEGVRRELEEMAAVFNKSIPIYESRHGETTAEEATTEGPWWKRIWN